MYVRVRVRVRACMCVCVCVLGFFSTVYSAMIGMKKVMFFKKLIILY